MMLMRVALLALGIALAVPASAADLTVSDGWIRFLPAGVPAGGYFNLHNAAAKPAYLTGATAPAYGEVMLHKTMTMDGMSKMEAVEKVEVPPHGELRFAPGGYHLMLMAPKRKIAPGDRIPVTLQFSDGQRVTAEFSVRGPTGK